MRFSQPHRRAFPAVARGGTIILSWLISVSTLTGQQRADAVAPPLPSHPFRLEVALQATDVVEPSWSEAEVTEGVTADSAAEMSLIDIEQLALSRHPAVTEAMAEYNAARGRWLQVGLKPNPSAGYAASEIGNDGRAGQQGAYVGQTFVRGGKLQLNRAVASHEIVMRQQDIVAAEQQVLTDARLAFYDLLVLQDRAEILAKLVELTEQAETTAKQLFEARESPKTDYLQASVELGRIQLDVQTTRVSLRRAQQVLATRVALEQLPARRVRGDLQKSVAPIEWPAVLEQVLATHPTLLKAQADVQRARCTVAREQAEPVPDLVSQGTVQYDDATQYTVVGVQAGFTLPLWNRNQGAISAAWAELRAAEQRVLQVRLKLQAQLADHMTQYTTAHQRVLAYQRDILPQAAETQQLISQAYRQGEVGFLDYLTAQRTYFEANLKYVEALQSYWSGRALVLGMLPPVTGVQ